MLANKYFWIFPEIFNFAPVYYRNNCNAFMIKVTQLRKNYGPVEAVRSIDFEISDGEIVGFLGANGAGKTTTLKMITGYLAPTSGTVEVNGLNISDSQLEIQKQIGYLPETNPLYGEMSVHEYLEFIAKIRGISGKDFTAALRRVVSKCGLKGVVHKSVSACSKGYRQRIGLAAAMIHDPDILILDEPVTGLDPNQIVEIRELIKDLGREKLVLMSSHILQEIQATVDRILIIDKGEIIADGTSEELMTNFMRKVKLTLEVKNASEETIAAVSGKIPEITLLSSEQESDITMIHFEYGRELDPREALFHYAVESGWIILNMTPHTANLEDVFRTMTSSGETNG